MIVQDWFRSAGDLPPDVPRVYCFAHAGGDPAMFLGWQTLLGEAAAIVAVTMPGRAHRFAEPAPATVGEYADGAARAIAAHGASSYVLFGHSLGALVAFETARRLRAEAGLRHLVASGASAPRLMPSARVVRAAALQGRAFAEAVGSFGGLPPEVVAAEELHALLLSGVQADFRLAADYRYRLAAPLPISVTVINGANDDHVTAERLANWSSETVQPLHQRWAPGGHFYLRDNPQVVVDVLRQVAGADAAAVAGHSDLLI